MISPLARIDDQYEIVAKIKEGGMGEIYKVRHRLLDELRVVKILHPELVGDSELNERFAREARAAIQLRHPNIVQIFDFTLDASGAGLIIMEYIRGTDLKQLVAGSSLPSIALTVEIARQGLRALGYLHRHGFVHRDVSPDNLMLSADVEGRPLVKIIDLGIAKRRGSDPQLTASGIFLGKFRYSSPEHFGAHGSGGIEARSDLYTFGLVLYELLTGQYPIRGESTSELIAGHLFQPPRGFSETDPAGRVPEPLRRAVLKTLAKEPAERFANAEDLIARIDRLQVDHPVSEAVLEESRGFVAGAVPRSRSAASQAVASRAAASRAETPAAVAPAEVPTEDAGSAARQAAIESLSGEVEELLRSGRLTKADRVLFQAHEVHGPAPELSALRQHQERRRQEDAIAGLERRLLFLIRRQDLVAAQEILTKAEAAADPGSESAFAPLRRLVAKTVEERIQELVKQAGVAFEAERFSSAVDNLRQVLALDPQNAWIRSRLTRAEAGLRRQEEEVRRRRSRDGKLRACLGEAKAARDGNDVLRARLLVARALELKPDDGDAAALARSLDQQLRAAELQHSNLRTTPLSPGLMKAYTDIEGLRAAGDSLAAWRRLGEAIEEFGEIDTFMKLRRLIAEEILHDDERSL